MLPFIYASTLTTTHQPQQQRSKEIMRASMGIPPQAIPPHPLQQPPLPEQRLSWHSPVPYLFGGLTAILGLIAFALLVLACSYWKLSGYLDEENGRDEEREREDAIGVKPLEEGTVKVMPLLEEKMVVIMAGDDMPTFLATPMWSRDSFFGDRSNNGDGKGHQEEETKKEDHDNKYDGKEVGKDGYGPKSSIQDEGHS